MYEDVKVDLHMYLNLRHQIINKFDVLHPEFKPIKKVLTERNLLNKKANDEACLEALKKLLAELPAPEVKELLV